MKTRPLRLAWMVLLTAFAVFCFLVVAIPMGVRWYLNNAQLERTATVESLRGTIVIEPLVGTGPVPLGSGASMTIAEGTTLRVDETSEAFVRCFDHTIHLQPDTTVRIERMREPRFASSALPDMVHIHLVGGTIHIGTALALKAPLDFHVTTLHAEFDLAADGSYALEATNDRSDVSVWRGQAVVSAAGQTITLESRQRTQVALGQPPSDPTDVARDLVVNGTFEEPLATGWRVFNDQGADGGEIDGHIEPVVDEGRRAVSLVRTGAQGDHCETILEQDINHTLADPVTSLKVRATAKLRYQSLSGGGYLSSEYPLMIRIVYRDVYDSEAEWIQGFYYQNTAGYSTTFGQKLPRDVWYPFESPNLLEILSVRPFKIMSIRVYASGWAYESLVSDIHIIVE